MLSRQKNQYRQNRKIIFGILLFGAAWLSVNITLAQSGRIITEEAQTLAGYSLIGSIFTIIMAVLGLGCLALIGKVENKYLGNKPSRIRYR